MLGVLQVLFFDKETDQSFSRSKSETKLSQVLTGLERPNIFKPAVDRGKNPLQQKGSLVVSQVPIRLMNVWYGRPDGIMDPLPF